MNFDPKGTEGVADDESAGQFKVHYHLQGGLHRMDAVTRNKAESELLALLKEISHIVGAHFRIQSRAYGEGGVTEYFNFIFQNKEQIFLVMSLLGPLLGTPFYLAKIRQTKQQTLLNELNIEKLKLEIKDKQEAATDRSEKKTKAGINEPLALEPPLTSDEIVQALLSRKKIARRRSNYYEALLDDSKIEAVGFAPTHRKGAAEKVVQRLEFSAFILERTDLEPAIYKQIPIEIVSPVLRSGSIKWRGIFDKKIVSFDLEDERFRERVSDKRVQFQNGTTLICDLEVLQREDATGETEVAGYVVSKVYEVKSPILAIATAAEEQLSFPLIERPTGGAAFGSGSRESQRQLRPDDAEKPL